MLFTFDTDAVVHLINKLPTAQQRINARKKVKEIASRSIDSEIAKNREVLRSMRSESESLKRGVYAEISKLEQVKLKMNAGEFGF